MKDRVPLYPGRVTLTPVSGQANTFDLVRADQPTQEGTPLNKASLLKDTTAALFGLPNTAVPDDALHLLSRFQGGLGNEYVWAKLNSIAGYYEIRTLKDSIYVIESATKLYTFKYSDSITIDEVGNLSLTNPLTFTATYSQFRNDYGTTLLGKYLDTTGLAQEAGIIFIPTNASINYDNGRQVEIRNSYVISVGYDENRALVGYVNSPSPDAYPPAVSDGNTYMPLGQLGDKVRIATGSYTGTGTYGASHPNSLTFEFAPKIVLLTIANTGKSGNNPYAYPMLFGSNVGAQDGFTSYIMHTDMLSTTYKNGLGFAGIGSSNYSYTYGKKSSDGKTFSWYNTTDDSAQCNRPASSGLVYHYFAIG